MATFCWYIKRSARISTLLLVVMLLVVVDVFAVPTSFQWRSYDSGGSTSFGVYDSDDITPLQGGDLLQLIYAGPDGEIDPPTASGASTDDDVLLDEGAIMDNASLPPPLRDRGYFDELFSYDTDGWSDGIVVYVRAWNGDTVGAATHYGNSSTTTLSGGGVATLPRWNTAGPTAVTLSSFTATPSQDEILIEWETASEQDLQGFNLYRAETPDGIDTGTYVQLNDTLIPVEGDPIQGASYSFPDQEVVGRVRYYYWLEDVAVGGFGTLHGPEDAALAGYNIYLPLIVRH
jgi:hypothetical protein